MDELENYKMLFTFADAQHLYPFLALEKLGKPSVVKVFINATTSVLDQFIWIFASHYVWIPSLDPESLISCASFYSVDILCKNRQQIKVKRMQQQGQS